MHAPAIQFISSRGPRALITDGEWKGWLCFRHPDGQWVSERKTEPAEYEQLLSLYGPPNPISELKAKDLKACAHCASKPVTLKNEYDDGIFRVRCSKMACMLNQAWFNPDQWNTRPREAELEEELAEANEHNDSELPLSEVMKRISEAVMDFQPDLESCSAGTLPERVETAAACGRGEFARCKQLEALLEDVSSIVKNRFDLDSDDPLSEKLSAIKAALEEKR